MRQWIELCQSRQIYQHFFERIQRYDGPTNSLIKLDNGRELQIDLRDLSEAQFKRATLIPAFDRVEAMEQSPIFQIMAQDFPEIAVYVRVAKKQNHKVLARSLQRLESTLMIDGLGACLQRSIPKYQFNRSMTPSWSRSSTRATARLNS
ncbi:MAG: hypothetical protein R3C28_02710 [Pirellulaceae bacterium]